MRVDELLCVVDLTFDCSDLKLNLQKVCPVTFQKKLDLVVMIDVAHFNRVEKIKDFKKVSDLPI